MPPVGWQRTWEQPAQTTTVWACEKTVVMVKQPGHLTSMKKERGPGTRVWRAMLEMRLKVATRVCLVGLYLQLVLAGLVLRARVEKVDGENL